MRLKGDRCFHLALQLLLRYDGGKQQQEQIGAASEKNCVLFKCCTNPVVRSPVANLGVEPLVGSRDKPKGSCTDCREGKEEKNKAFWREIDSDATEMWEVDCEIIFEFKYKVKVQWSFTKTRFTVRRLAVLQILLYNFGEHNAFTAHCFFHHREKCENVNVVRP